MRNLVLGAAAALLVFACPGLAAAQSGYVDLNYTRANTDPGGIDSHSYGINGAVEFGLTQELGTQLDGAFQYQEVQHGGSGGTGHLDAHLFTRTANWQWGGVLAYDHINPKHGDGSDVWTGAGEALFFQPKMTWAFTLSYSDSHDLDTSLWTVNVEGRYFVSDHFRIDGDLGLGNANTPTSNSAGSWNASIGAEYLFQSVPFSVFGGYQYTAFDTQPRVSTDALVIGVRWNFGGNLFERDRSGANLKRPAAVIAGL